MDSWKILKTEEVMLGDTNFLEVSLKQSPEKIKLIAISKGWKTPQGEKRYKTNMLFDTSKIDEVINAINKIKQ